MNYNCTIRACHGSTNSREIHTFIYTRRQTSVHNTTLNGQTTLGKPQLHITKQFQPALRERTIRCAWDRCAWDRCAFTCLTILFYNIDAISFHHTITSLGGFWDKSNFLTATRCIWTSQWMKHCNPIQMQKEEGSHNAFLSPTYTNCTGQVTTTSRFTV